MSRIRDWIALVEGHDDLVALFEAFDQPLALTPNPEREEAIRAHLGPVVNSVSVFDAELEGQVFEFVEFRYRGAWEVHFNNRTAGYSLDVGDTLRGSGMTRIVATILALFDRRITKGNPIRYYAENERMRRLLDRAFAIFDKKKHGGKLMRMEIPNFRAAYGKIVPAVVMQLDTRTAPLPNKPMEEARACMIRASAVALNERT